jgi:hypothetical protein
LDDDDDDDDDDDGVDDFLRIFALTMDAASRNFQRSIECPSS